MDHTITELLWLLLVYSFLGWIIETVVGTVKNRTFINRGFSQDLSAWSTESLRSL